MNWPPQGSNPFKVARSVISTARASLPPRTVILSGFPLAYVEGTPTSVVKMHSRPSQRRPASRSRLSSIITSRECWLSELRRFRRRLSSPFALCRSVRRRATEAVTAQADIIDVPAERADVRVAGEVKTDRHGLAGIIRQVNDDLLIGAEPTIHPRRSAGERAARAFPDRAGVTAFDDLRAEVFKVTARRNLQHAAVERAIFKFEHVVEDELQIAPVRRQGDGLRRQVSVGR